MTGFYHKVDRSLSTVWQSQKNKSCLEQKNEREFMRDSSPLHLLPLILRFTAHYEGEELI